MTHSRTARFSALVAADVPTLRRGVLSYVGSDADPEQLSHLGVMTTELVSNVLDHTSSIAAVCVEVGDCHVRVMVQDSGGGWPIVRPLDPKRVGGNGLRIVEALSSSWGVIHLPTEGKAVWFLVDT